MSLIFLVLLLGCGGSRPESPVEGAWDAWLDSPGGSLRFNLALRSADEGLRASITGGDEVLHPLVRVEGEEVVLDFPHFDATIRFRHDAALDRLEGVWRKHVTGDDWAELGFHAQRGGCRNLAPAERPDLGGRWAVDFESDDDVAVAVLERVSAGEPFYEGTILTSKGDYRYLWGEVDAEGTLQLQAFDGAHAFLFRATLQDDGTLKGDFWSRDSWHETWTARRDDVVELPDPFALNSVREDVDWTALEYPGVDGVEVALGDPSFAGRARIVELFGTWCPNCYDATRYLMELDARYRDRGLSILGLAFELSGDFDRDAAQVRRYVEHHGLEYPILIAGTSDKLDASQRFPVLDRVHAYPTFLFIDAENRIRAVYTGFSGPATGPAYEALRSAFESLVEEMLQEAGS